MVYNLVSDGPHGTQSHTGKVSTVLTNRVGAMGSTDWLGRGQGELIIALKAALLMSCLLS